MGSYRIISADNHIVEPDDLWTGRIEPEFRDQAPRIVHEEGTGGDWWYCDGRRMLGMAFAGAQAGTRFDEPEALTMDDTFENVRLGGYIPEEHVKDLGPGRRGHERGLSHAWARALQSSGQRALHRPVQDLQRLDSRVLLLRPQAAEGHRHDQPGQHRRGCKGAGALCQAGTGGSDDLRLPRQQKVLSPGSTTPSGRPPRTWRCP